MSKFNSIRFNSQHNCFESGKDGLSLFLSVDQSKASQSWIFVSPHILSKLSTDAARVAISMT